MLLCPTNVPHIQDATRIGIGGQAQLPGCSPPNCELPGGGSSQGSSPYDTTNDRSGDRGSPCGAASANGLISPYPPHPRQRRCTDQPQQSLLHRPRSSNRSISRPQPPWLTASRGRCLPPIGPDKFTAVLLDLPDDICGRAEDRGRGRQRFGSGPTRMLHLRLLGEAARCDSIWPIRAFPRPSPCISAPLTGRGRQAASCRCSRLAGQAFPSSLEPFRTHPVDSPAPFIRPDPPASLRQNAAPDPVHPSHAPPSRPHRQHPPRGDLGPP